MSQPIIQHWDRLINKNVRSEDWIVIGNVISESGDTFTVMQGASREYNIPKSAVKAFDGPELLLSILFSAVLRYKVTYCTPVPFFQIALKKCHQY
jgi:hypothetical protein